MFSKVAVILSAFVLAVAAGSQCNTGDMLCCDSVQSATSPDAVKAIGAFNAVVKDINAQVGLTCVPVSILAANGNSCSTQPVCCEDNNYSGAVAIGCTPVNVNA